MVEITNKRKLDSKTFDTGNTKIDPVTRKTVPIYGTKIQKGLHYRKNGSLHDVDTTVLSKEVDEDLYEFTHKVDKARVKIRFGDNSSNTKKHLFGIEDNNDNWLNIKLDKVGYDMAGVIENKPTFTNGMTIEHIPTYKGVKTNYMLGSSGVNELTVTFKYNQELTPEQRENTIVFLRDDKVIFIIESPFAYDAVVGMEEVEPVVMVLGETGGFKSATLTVDSDWLENATDPIIDPNVTIDDDSGTFLDTLITNNSGTGNNNLGATPFGQTFNNGVNARQHELMKVDLSAFSGIRVIAARFGIDIYLGVFPIDVKWSRVLKDWVEGTKDNTLASTGETTFNNQFHPATPWGTAGCLQDGVDRQTAPEGSATITGLNSDYHLNMTIVTVQAWLDDAANNNGILDEAPNNVASKLVRWRSSESVEGNKPYFYMEYTVISMRVTGIFGVGRMGAR